MPNWCYNMVTITTDTPKQFAELIQGISNDSEQPFDFNRVIPMPEELRNTGAPNRENAQEMIAKHGFSDWYEWSCAKWGTKWNACDVTFTLNSPTELYLSFNTAWSPPIPVIDKIAELFPFATIEHKYEEEGMGFYGLRSYENGELTSDEEGEMNCEYRRTNWGECYGECSDCGECDCEVCDCPNRSNETICKDCNNNNHTQTEGEENDLH